jgi:hypothetical protein
VTGSIHGYWGFDPFEGPTVNLQQIEGKDFKVVDGSKLMAGQDNKLTLKADGTGCVEHVALAREKDKDMEVNFKPADGKDAKDTLALDVSLKTVQPGGYALAVKQFGSKDVEKLPLTAYDAAINFDEVKIHGGDDAFVMTGRGLKNVVSVELAKQTFTPEGEANDDSTLHLHAGAGVSPENGSEAIVKLKDGRTIPVKVSAEAARPTLKLLSFKATQEPRDGAMPVTLGAKEDIALDGKLTFVVQTKEVFARTQTVEVATANGAVKTTLSLLSNTLVLQDDHTAVATLNPLKAFGESAFGKLAMRPVAQDGTAGDWTGLGVLVRTPTITAIHCTTSDSPTCTVDGSQLFLVQSFAAEKDFAKPTEVPTGFADSSIAVPTPADGATIYLKLRDDPNTFASVTLPTPIQKGPASAAANAGAQSGSVATAKTGHDAP